LLERKEREEMEARWSGVLMLWATGSSMAGWTAACPCSAMRLSERRMPALIDELEWTVHTGSVLGVGGVLSCVLIEA
jgi:hypothetical protein